MRGVLLVASALLAAPAAPAADLMNLYREAQVQDAQYAGAKAQYIGTQERLPQGRALLLPNANFNAGYNYNWLQANYNNPLFRSGTYDFYGYNYGITVTQPLYRPQNSMVYEQAKTQVKQAESQLSLAAQDLMVRVSQAYFDVLLARSNLSTVRSQKSALAEQLEQAKRNFVVGTATITDQREAQARYDLVVAQEIAAVNELEVKNRALEVLIGHPVSGPLAGLRLPIALNSPAPNDMGVWVEQAYQSSLEVQFALQALELAKQEIERTRGGHMPTVDAVGSVNDTYAANSSFGVGSDIRQATIGLQFVLPLYQGGAVSSQIREAVAKQERARQDLENARRTVAQRTREAFLGVTSGLAQVSALEQAVSSTELQLEATKLGQEVGVRTAVDVLNAEQQLSSAQRDLNQAIYNTILNQLKLKAAVGRLAERDLSDVNNLLKEEVQ